MKKALSFLLCVFLLIFLICSPALIAAGIDRSVFSNKEKERLDDYRGTLTVWHVVSFKTPAGSGYDYIKARAAKFEKNTPYVFVDVKGMTVEEAKRRMSEGDKPDVISYPMGTFAEEEMLALPDAENNIPLLSKRFSKARPYMADSYVLAVNRDILREHGVQQGFSAEMSQEMFYDAYKKLTAAGFAAVAGTETIGLSPENALKNLVLSKDESFAGEIDVPEKLTLEKNSSLFAEGKTGMYLCPYAEFARMKEAGLKFSAEAYSVTDYTDMIQLMGVYGSEDDAKNEMLLRLADQFFTVSAQKKLEGIAMLPCTIVPEIYEADADRLDQYQRFCENVMISD